MASFDRDWAYATLSICHCKYSCNHVPFLRYLTLKNILTMKSSLGITHPANLYTIAEIYRPRVIFLPLIVRVCLTFACTQWAPEEVGWGCALRLSRVIQGHWNIGTSPCANYYYYSPLLWCYVYLLSFARYNDWLIENLHFLLLSLTAVSFEATAREFPLCISSDLKVLYKSVIIYYYYLLLLSRVWKLVWKKVEVHGLSDGEHRMSLRSLVLMYCHRLLDRQTDGRTHRL